jgi:hypothetical protein
MSTEPTQTTRPDAATNRTADNQSRTRAGARPASPRTDPWASDDTKFTARNAPRTFDPFCTRRLRNLTDDENAATPDSGA